ncbi:hypothetical protein CVS40_10498 [Lucilia cuprina]|nr:hypothetical protein CVS40_10498 [Lucilia cuprina]
MRDLVEQKQQSGETVDILRIVYPISVSSVEQLRVECNEAERNFPKRDVRSIQPMSRPMKYVNEINDTDVMVMESPLDEYEEVAAINTYPQLRKPQVVCWNCRQLGHMFMECPSQERSLFCYKCGKPNVITPRCPNCQSGNQSRSLGVKGDPRSSENLSPK